MYTFVIESLTIILLLADRLYRLRAAKEYRQAKDAQIAALQQQLEIERRNNDTGLAELLKDRYEHLKLVVNDREELAEELVEELNAMALVRHRLETELKALSQQLKPKQLVDLRKLKIK